MAGEQQQDGSSAGAAEGAGEDARPSLPYLDSMSEFARSSTDVV